MPHKFKIGDIVKYRPADRRHREADGVYIVTFRLPGDGQSQYRIKHPSEDFERVALENEFLVLRTKCTRATNAKAHTQRARRPGERNRDLPRPSRNVTSSSRMWRAMWFHNCPPTRAPNPPRSAG